MISNTTKTKKDGKTISSNELGHKINITQLLKDNYSYISQSINEDTYQLRVKECDLFRELIYKDKIVGFVSYTILNNVQYILTDIYITKGYRRNHLLYNELKQQLSDGKILSIYQPTRQVVEALITYDFARKVTDTVVISAINFNMNSSEVCSLGNTKKFNNKFIITNLYDLNLCTPLSIKIFNKQRYDIFYTDYYPDDVRFNCKEKRANLDSAYFTNIINSIMIQDSEIERWLFLLQHNLPSKEIKTEDIIGTPKSFSKKLTDALEEGKITSREAKLIQNQLFLELRTRDVTKEALPLRLNYLINNVHEKITKDNKTDKYCEYCYDDIDYLDNYCLNCGYTLYNINDLNETDFVYKELLEEKRSYRYSLTGIKEKKKHNSEEYLIHLASCLIMDKIEKAIVWDDIFDTTARKYNLTDINLNRVMLEKGFITYNMNESKWNQESEYFKVTELKNILKKYNKKVSGNKQDLIERISREVPLEEIESFSPSVTIEGLHFKSENSDLMFHYAVLNDYIYEEYKEFVNEFKEEKENYLILIEFLNKHVKMAIETSNHDQLIDSMRIQSDIYSKNEMYDELLENELKIFLYNLNMCYIKRNYQRYYKPIDEKSRKFFSKCMKLYTNDEFVEKFNEIYQTINIPLIVSYTDTSRYLKEIFNNHTLNIINKEIMHKYYRIHNNERKRTKQRKNTYSTILESFL